MTKAYKDVAGVILGVLVFCIVFAIAEKSGLRDKIIGGEALISRGIENYNLSVDNKFFDFGRVSMREGEKRHLFELKNNSTKDVVVEKVYTTCQCLEIYLINNQKKIGPFSVKDYLYPDIQKFLIKKGEKIKAEVIYTSSLQGPFGVGLSEPFAVIEDGQKNKIHLRISALVLP